MIPLRIIPLQGTTGVTISASTSDVTLRTVANAQGYTSGNCRITINGGVVVSSTSVASAALVTGSWPAGVTVTLVNNGTVSGAGGVGGLGGGTNNGSTGTPGEAGGTALSATGVSGFTFVVDNTSGTLRGGGGGGGGGGFSVYVGADADTPGYGGGGGGGAAGPNSPHGGAFGTGNDILGPVPARDGSTGSSGSPSAAGGGGAGGPADADAGPGVAGGTGGAYGTAGSAGTNGLGGSGGTGNGGAGGAAGNSVTGNANITWTATGTRTGPIS